MMIDKEHDETQAITRVAQPLADLTGKNGAGILMMTDVFGSTCVVHE